MRKFLIFVLIVLGIFYWASNFIKTGKLQDYIDKNSDKSWAPKLQFNLGKIYKTASNYEHAELCFKRISEKYPESEYNVEAMYQLGLVYAETQRRHQAIEVLKRIVQEYPEYEEIKRVKNRLDVLMSF
ncbi:MAG: tetratricopeptide repeat protein [Elusimicrobia bacterium]|nr:tetratricopeptide repeat protein [Elusimicrobiota bacterium]